ncbi:MAG TPA: histidine kinase dimerization/phosphoacceptor domain -containing protein [Kofleriaceae bacterium]|nr:histidine kinase dimerization/phosphoacceptor domain -containing protein [Kofleriaceae bacterium]
MTAAVILRHATRAVRPRAYVLGNIAIVALYVATGELARRLNQPYGTVAGICGPSGIGFALIVLYGARWIPGVALGTFLVVVTRHHAPAALFVTGLEVIEAVTIRFVLREGLNFRPQLDRARDVFALVIVDVGVSLAGSVIGSYIAMHNFVPLGWSAPGTFVTTWRVWAWANLSGDLLVAPALLTWLAHSPLPRRPQWVEIVALVAVALLVTTAILASWIPIWIPAARAPYYLLPVMLWAGVRFGPRGAAASSLVVSLCAMIADWMGLGPFPQRPELQVFVAFSAITALVVAALTQERVSEGERRAAIQQAALDAIITVDDRARILELNPAAERLFMVREADVVGKDIAPLFIPPRMREAFYRGFAHYVDTGQGAIVGSRYRTTAWRAADGHEFPVEIAVTRPPIEEQLILTGFIRDASAEAAAEVVQREAEANLERKVTERTLELRKALEQGDVLLREIHHRVKNNLQVIASLLNLQASTTTSEVARIALVESQNRVAAMALVHQLLYQSKNIESIELGEYLRGLAQRLAMVYRLDTTRIAIEVVARPAHLDLDRAISCGVIVNELVTNAIVHAFPEDRKGKITIRVAQVDDTIGLTVDDDGIGMPSDFRIEGASTFGLTLVHALTAQLDGTITRLPSEGTAIRVSFPASVVKKAAA